LQPGASAAEFRTQTAVTAILVTDGRVTGVETSAGPVAASAVILATGGPAWPAAGATPDGFRMLEALGHTVIPPRPGLAPLHTDAAWIRNLQGLSIPRARLSCLAAPDKKGGKARTVSVEGPLLFTHFGLSGPAALDLSLHLAETPAEITVSLLPDYTTEALDQQLIGVAAQHGQRRLDLLLKSALPQRAAQAVLAAVGIPEEVWLGQLKKEWRRAAAVALTAMSVRITRLGGWDEAMITVGGCALGQISPQTMESRKVAGLYVVGELLDLAGPTGGYNLHAALATGRLAARSLGGM
jgi:predicted Rossmann fold flavoprotein